VAITFPERFQGAPAQLQVVPTAPLDRYVPPCLLPVTLETGVSVALPGANETLVIAGKLEPADPTTKLEVEYQARARMGGRLVSNVAVTGPDGAFTLRLQKSVVSTGGQPLSVELSPTETSQPLPTLHISPVDPTKSSLGTLRLPAHQKPETFLVPVVARGIKVVGATVRFTASLSTTSQTQEPTAVYTRVAQTDNEGNAMIPLIPGTSAKTRDYTVKVTPPKNSEFAARCLGTYAVAAGSAGGAAPRVGAAIELGSKVVLSGRVMQANGAAARSVRVKATREGDAFKEECGGDLVSPPSETTTGPDGRYRLLLDPGGYRIELEPPPGAPMPMGVESWEVVDTMTRDVTLRPPLLVEGQVVSPEGMPLRDAEVRAFDFIGEKARIRGIALSDPDGKFRLVLPR
jgi:hypothetical protein